MIELDINTARIVITVLLAVSFIGLCIFVFFSKSRSYDEAAQYPFNEPDVNEERGKQ